jgi:general secretion pathway protein M
MNASAWWQGREPRERRTLAIGAVVVAAMLVWALLWKPLQDSRAALVEGNARLAADLAGMRAAAVRLQGGAAPTDAARARAGQSLLALADAGIREIGLGGSLKRIEPDGERRVRLRLEAVPFDPLAAWLQRLDSDHGIVVSELAANATEYVGQVDVQLVLEDP